MFLHTCPIFFYPYILSQCLRLHTLNSNGKSNTIEIANGLSVMEGAVQNNITRNRC